MSKNIKEEMIKEDKIEILKLFSKEALIKELASRDNVSVDDGVFSTTIEVHKV